MRSRMVCSGCGTEVGPDEPYPFRCPKAGADADVDHVLVRVLDMSAVTFPSAGSQEASENPYVRYRELFRSHHLAQRFGLDDSGFVEIVKLLDESVARIDGDGFRVTPFAREDDLSERLGFSPSGGVWVKNETGNVSGSHKARHLMGLLIHLEVAERVGLIDPADRDARPLAIEGGITLGYEIASQLREAGASLDRVVVQVGGGTLATAVVQGLREAHGLGALDRVPALHTVQTTGASPLARAFDRVVAWRRERGAPIDEAIAYPRTHRHEFMWPWEQEPHSVAHGILDDETYDWLAVVRAMLETGGSAVVVDEATLREANRTGFDATGTPAGHTGTSGLAGLMKLRRRGEIGGDERIAVLFTGIRRE